MTVDICFCCAGVEGEDDADEIIAVIEPLSILSISDPCVTLQEHCFVFASLTVVTRRAELLT
jgi:hypothetical protein